MWYSRCAECVSTRHNGLSYLQLAYLLTYRLHTLPTYFKDDNANNLKGALTMFVAFAVFGMVST